MDDGAMIRMFPNGTFMALAPIALLGKRASHKMHHQPHTFGVVNVYDDVRVIAGDRVPINRNPVALRGCTQPFPIRIPISRKLQKKTPIMTAVGEMESVPLTQIS